MHKLFIVNAGSGFKMLWKALKAFLDARTLAKITVSFISPHRFTLIGGLRRLDKQNVQYNLETEHLDFLSSGAGRRLSQRSRRSYRSCVCSGTSILVLHLEGGIG